MSFAESPLHGVFFILRSTTFRLTKLLHEFDIALKQGQILVLGHHAFAL